jgi:hypothetical protein
VGFGFEPGEIEARLREIAGIRDAAVVTHSGPDGGNSLVAYVAGGAGVAALDDGMVLMDGSPEHGAVFAFPPATEMQDGRTAALTKEHLSAITSFSSAIRLLRLSRKRTHCSRGSKAIADVR